MPPGRESRPAGNGAATISTGIKFTSDSTPRPRLSRRILEARRQRRREAYWLAHVEPVVVSTSTYGMTADELYAYAEHLRRAGWQDWELRARLTDPRTVAA